MKNIIISITLTVLFVLFFSVGFILNKGRQQNKQQVLSVESTPTPTPLIRYQMDKLNKPSQERSEIIVKEKISEEEDYTSYIFEYKFDPTLVTGVKKSITGQLNIPNEKKKYPLVLMIRGYVDKEIYETGVGTRNSAAYFAKNGFITLAPDFLGYAGSDIESLDILEARFQTYTTVISLLNSLESIDAWDGQNIFIWAHSNGGQIALTTLAATAKEIPTTLWAPVTKPFPYSILYYTDELEDGGKYIRSELSKFENVYDIEKFSFSNYLENITSPIQLHQGGEDDAVPVEWSEEFVDMLEEQKSEVEYFYYPDADHNMSPNWETAISRDLNFFKSLLKNNQK